MDTEMRARNLLANVLNTQATDLPEAPRIGDCPGWDSLAHMRLIMAIEEETGRTLAAEELMSIDALTDVTKILGATLAE